MTDFGSRLKQAREARGISQRQIAAATKISTVALEALERNDFSRLPGGIFSRAFVRAYALEVGLDPEQTVQDFLVEYEQNYSAQAEKAPPEITADDRAFLDRQQRAARWLRAGSIGLMVVLATLFLAWRVMSSGEPAQVADPKSNPPRPTKSAAPPPVASPAPERPAQAEPPPPPPATSSTPNPTTVTPPPVAAALAPDQVALRLQITGDCWVRVTVDGSLVFEQILTAGETRDIRPGRDVYLQVGNAGVVRWFINGQPAKELGKPGQTAAVRINKSTLARYVGP